jgi:hypothetical protein
VPGSGMPTPGSYSFSQTGQRTQFIDIVSEAVEEQIPAMIWDGLKQNFYEKMNQIQVKIK